MFKASTAAPALNRSLAASRAPSASSAAALVNNFRAERSLTTAVEDNLTASDAWKKSCYVEIEYTIQEDATVYDAVQRMAAFDIGCLVTVDGDDRITGVISERDYVNKIALLGRKSQETSIREISTKSANLITASPDDSVDNCMQKMLSKDIRHLPLLDGDGKVVGMLSIKDLVKSVVAHQEETIKILSDFALGKGGHFGSD